MRDLVIKRLAVIIGMSGGHGIPRCFDCDDDDNITDASDLDTMSDEQLLEAFEATIGFGG